MGAAANLYCMYLSLTCFRPLASQYCISAPKSFKRGEGMYLFRQGARRDVDEGSKPNQTPHPKPKPKLPSLSYRGKPSLLVDGSTVTGPLGDSIAEVVGSLVSCKRHDGDLPGARLDSLPRLRVVFPLQLKFPAVDC